MLSAYLEYKQGIVDINNLRKHEDTLKEHTKLYK